MLKIIMCVFHNEKGKRERKRKKGKREKGKYLFN